MSPITRLFCGAACLGFAPIFVKWVTMGPTAIGLYRCGIAAAILWLYSFFRYRNRWQGLWRHPSALWTRLVGAGLFFAIDLFVWHRSVLYVGAGMGTIFANTQIFYVGLVGVLFFGEKFTLRLCVSILLAFAGVVLMVSYRLPNAAESPFYSLGVTYGLLTGVVYASYVLTLRSADRMAAGIPAEQVLCVVSGFTALFLLAAAAIEGDLSWPSAKDWLHLVGLAAIAQVAGWMFITRNLAKVDASTAGVILTVQPLVATLLGYIFFAESMGWMQYLGAALTLGGIYLSASRRRHSAAKGRTPLPTT